MILLHPWLIQSSLQLSAYKKKMAACVHHAGRQYACRVTISSQCAQNFLGFSIESPKPW